MGQAQLPPQETAKSSLAKNLGRVGVGLAIAITASSLGAFWYGRYFLNEELSPLLQSELTKSLKRPLQLGKVERVGLSSMRFGRSIIPPTDKESNFLVVEAIEVKFDVWSYALRRQITLDAIAEQPQIFLKQDATGLLQLPEIKPPERQTKDSFIDLRTIAFRDAQITVQTIARGELVSLSQVQIDSNWKIADLNNQSFQMNGKGNVALPNISPKPQNPESLYPEDPGGFIINIICNCTSKPATSTTTGTPSTRPLTPPPSHPPSATSQSSPSSSSSKKE